MTTVEIGRGTCLREGADVAVLTIGPVADDALRRQPKKPPPKGVEAAVYDMQFIKPIDTSILERWPPPAARDNRRGRLCHRRPRRRRGRMVRRQRACGNSDSNGHPRPIHTPGKPRTTARHVRLRL